MNQPTVTCLFYGLIIVGAYNPQSEIYYDLDTEELIVDFGRELPLETACDMRNHNWFRCLDGKRWRFAIPSRNPMVKNEADTSGKPRKVG